jgi:YYY domain-containing protein
MGERRRNHRSWLAFILVVGAAARLADLSWDEGHAFHPDERAIAFAVQRLSFRPLQLDPDFFAYGSFPFYVIRAATSLAGLVRPEWRDDFGVILLTGRAWSALTGVLALWVLFRLGSALYGRAAGLLAAGLMAGCILHIQHSHFMTSDVALTSAVLLALWACVGVVRHGRARDHVAAGVAVGLALAIKLSAAPLLAALGTAVLLRLRNPSFRLRHGVYAIGAAAAACFLGQPYALLDPSRFWGAISEQGHMVREAGSLPYTIQYLGTTPYAYDLSQMVLWGMGPALGLAALAGAAWQVRRQWTERTPEVMVLGAWLLPYFAITGAFEVKFIRYLLPAYPVLILWAAAWLLERARAGPRGRFLLYSVVAATSLSALAFLTVYRGRHTAVLASDWVYAHVPAGSAILGQHWDEGFPLPTSSGRPESYRIRDFPYYDPDTPEKLAQLASELAAADYVALPTRRIYGAVTRAPDRYPDTNRYFQLLFAGELGFRVEHEQSARPLFLGLEVPDELADESFSVYDHPKVLLLANKERRGAEELHRRLVEAWPTRILSRTEILLAGAPHEGAWGRMASAPPVRASAPGLLLFALAVQALGWATFALMRRWLPRFWGYAAAKVVGVVLFAYAAWLLAHTIEGSFRRGWLTLLFVALVGAGAIAWSRGRRLLPPGWLAAEAVFWGGFGFFALLRSLDPAVFWGEKPMDFAFLNTLSRAASLPAPEPWFAGEPLRYTYFGHFMLAALGKVCHLHPGLTFNLGVALAGGLTAVAAFALGGVAGGRRRVALWTAALVVLVGNLSGPFELLRRRAADFDYFWATSRVLPGTINEYPLWSFLFADLHAHVLVLPLALTFLSLAIRWRRAASAGLFLLLALTLGGVMATNGWSTPTYALVLPFLLGCFARSLPDWLRAMATGLGVILAAFLLQAPFWRGYRVPLGAWGWQRGAYADGAGYVQVFGLFLLVVVPLVLVYALEPSARARWGRTGLAAFLLAAVAGQALAPWGALRVLLAALGLLAFVAARRAANPARLRIAAALSAFAFLVTAGCDLVYVWDRMNTVFKFYLDAWLIFAAASALALPAMWQGALLPGWPRGVWRAAFVVLLAAAALTGATSAVAVGRHDRARSPWPSLDGTAYLPLRHPHESEAIEWLNRRPGLPVVAEAWGDAYGDFARVSMNTGLPTVLGWEYHVHQRGRSWPEIEERKADLARLYQSGDGAEVASVLRKHHVGFVYVGALEARVYGEVVRQRFEAWPHLLAPAYRNDEESIYAVRGLQVAASLPVPATAPARASTAPPPDRLSQPRGVAADAEGHLYVADFDNHLVRKLAPTLELLASWGGEGEAPGRFRQPCQVAVAGDRLYVADTWNGRVQVLDTQGRFHAQWKSDFYGPRGIAVGRGGRVYVADTGNHRIRVFEPDGREVAAWGGRGSAPGEFVEPIGVATDSEGAVYVCDNGNARLQVFDAEGGFVRAFPVHGWRTETFSEPKVALTPGLIWVTVPLEGAVRAYSADGRLVREIRAFSDPDAPFTRPMGLAYNESRRELVVADLEGRLGRIPLPPSPRGGPGRSRDEARRP